MPVVKSLQVDFHEVIKLKKTNSFFVKLKTRFVVKGLLLYSLWLQHVKPLICLLDKNNIEFAETSYASKNRHSNSCCSRETN